MNMNTIFKISARSQLRRIQLFVRLQAYLADERVNERMNKGSSGHGNMKNSAHTRYTRNTLMQIAPQWLKKGDCNCIF